jgi:hypothetical protein
MLFVSFKYKYTPNEKTPHHHLPYRRRIRLKPGRKLKVLLQVGQNRLLQLEGLHEGGQWLACFG